MRRTYDAIVIGAGINGLVCAGLLARAGRRVLLLERRHSVGGCLEAGNHHVPPLRPRVRQALRLALEHRPLDPVVRAPHPDGRWIVLWRDVERAARSIAPFSRADASRYREYVRFMERVQQAAAGILDRTPPAPGTTEPVEWWDLAGVGLKLRMMGREDTLRLLRLASMPVADFLGEWFETPLLQATLAAPALWGRFAGPRSPGTAATLVYHTLAGPPGLYAGGLEALGESLAAVCREAGVDLVLGVSVERILVCRGTAVGVRLRGGEEVRAEAVLSSADPRQTFLGLVDPGHLPPKFRRQVRNIRMRGVTARVDLVLSRPPVFSGLESPVEGRFHLGPDLDTMERAFDDAKYGRISRVPVLDVMVEGRRVSILAQYAPYRLREGDWDSARETLYRAVLAVLEGYARDLPALVEEWRVFTPVDLERDYGLTEGHLHHGEHALDQLFFGRPVGGWCRYDSPVEGLFLCGAGAHPGGLPVGAAGANAACELLDRSHAAARSLRRARSAFSSPLVMGLAVLGAGVVAGAALRAPRSRGETGEAEEEA